MPLPVHTGPRPAAVTALLVLQAVIGTVALALLVWELGWPVSQAAARVSEWLTWGLVLLALLSETGLAWKDKRQSPIRRGLILGALVLLAVGRFGLERPLREWFGDLVSPRAAALFALIVIQVTLVIPFSLRLLRLTRSRFFQQARPGSLFVLSFLLAILGGTLMLKTPNATVDGLSWLDAFFTSTSAICVTGLIVVDTETAFTQEGQFIILGLIQIGGLGIMTLTYFMALITGQGFTLRDQARLGELFSEENLGSVGHFIGKIVILTLAVEAVGAALLYQNWSMQPPREGRLLWDSIFHAVSAFCNAGFSTFGDGLADPGAAMNRPVQAIIMVLMITAHCQELGVQRVYTRVINDVHEHLLGLMQVTGKIRAESLAAGYFSRQLTNDAVHRYFGIDADHGIVEIEMPAALDGQTLAEADLRHRFGLNVVTVRRPVADDPRSSGSEAAYTVMGTPDPTFKLQKHDHLVVFGRLKEIDRFSDQQ